MRLKIDVTQEDIDRGLQKSVFECPVALAVTRALQDLGLVNEHRTASFGGIVIMWMNHEGYIQSAEAPEEARLFAIAFDRGEPVAPFSFEIEVEN